ncbi:MAG TPA: amino acid adenylation domain-containing protein, partial [Thermoanaerobaculia bacterium]
RADFSGSPSFSTVLERVREEALGAFSHQDLPFERLVDAVVTRRDGSRPPLVQALFDWQSAQVERLEIPGLTFRPVELDLRSSRVELSLHLAEGPAGITGSLEFNTDLFDGATAERLLSRFAILLAAAAADPQQPAAGLPLLLPAERQQLLEWGGTGGEPAAGTLHGRFAAQARERPDAVAAVCAGESLTYGELSRRAGRLARRLRARGAGPDERIGLCADRSLELLVGLLGILEAGAAYVPLDPRYPMERLAFTLEDAGVRLLVGTGSALAGLPAGAERVLLDRDALPAEDSAPENGGTDWSEGASLAYVIYTSGSTGRPKGAMLSHGHAVRLFDATDAWFGFGASDVWTLFHSHAFDFSVWEIWGALLYGGRLVVVPYLVSRSPEDFHDLLARERVTVLNQTPSAFAQLQRADEEPGRSGLRTLRWVIFGGEALDPQGLAPWLDRYGDETPRLVNMYGITETTVHVTWRPLSRHDVKGRRSAIGVPIPDLAVAVLDPWLRTAPIGVPGELVVAGAGLARGYLNRPELTAERFVPDPAPDPAGSRPGARIYRSGDLARYLPDGDLEYLGRIDHQVKIRGFRIEPGEIEAALTALPGVREAVVIARSDRPDGSAGDPRLVAYLVGDPQADAELRRLLGERLPDYMVPAAFVTLDALPLTPNGKVDRKALPAPQRQGAGESSLAPHTPAEETLAGIWAEVLGRERVGVHDNFFELGGDSILSIQVVSRARQAGLQLSPRDLFQNQTVAELAAVARAAEPDLTPSDVPEARVSRQELDRLLAGLGVLSERRQEIETVYELSPMQQAMLFHSLYAPGSGVYVVQISLRLSGRLDTAAFLRAWQRVVERHAVLRTGFAWEGLEKPLQVVYRHAELEVRRESWADLADLADLDIAGQEDRLADTLRADRERGFDLGAAPLMRVGLFELGAQAWHLVWSQHHILSDGWTQGLLLGELFTCYAAFVEEREPSLPRVRPYRDYIAWLQRQDLAAAEEHWRQRLAGF